MSKKTQTNLFDDGDGEKKKERKPLPEWKQKLSQYMPAKHEDTYQPFRFIYMIKDTGGALIFKLPKHKSIMIPKSQLLCDKKEIIPGCYGWVYISYWICGKKGI